MSESGYTLVFVAVTFLGAEATSPPQPLTVPARPEDVTLQKSSLFYLWNQQQHFEDTFPVQRDTRAIGSLLSPAHHYIGNLVPQDSVHPLYSDSYARLRAELLLDHMLQDTVYPDDERMSSSNGLEVYTLNYNPVVFRKNNQGDIMVNDTLVQNVETLPGGIVSYTLDGVLSNYQQRVHEAFVELSKVSPPLWPFAQEEKRVRTP
ncbi:uncharacterized protein LOC119569252 [Penaeus monodon]|uniref:uncharacterized protein LOC119569252 n=1 Tax=Penaeus monodon TaxID=6687 RepID=UPI0018A721C1|nr:uncharacterized protein LOC119569252 [Penaeus monodon]